MLVQMNVAWEDRAENFRKVHALLDPITTDPGSLIVLPEMFATGFSMNTSATIESTPSPTEAFVIELARKKDCAVMAGVVSPGPGGKGRNECLVVDRHGGQLARYQKLFPFSFGGEDQHYEKGKEVVCFDLDGVAVSPFICYDLRFPEAFRIAATRGAELLTVIAQWPSRRTQHWVDLLKARAIENQAYVIGVNRCGTDPKLEYDGRSLVVDPHGKVIADAGSEEGVVTVTLDLDVVRNWRREFPALNDIRNDLLAHRPDLWSKALSALGKFMNADPDGLTFRPARARRPSTCSSPHRTCRRRRVPTRTPSPSLSLSEP